MNSSVMYWLWLSTRRGVSPQMGRDLFHAFDESIEKLYLAQRETLSSFNLGADALNALSNKSLDEGQKILENCAIHNQSILTYQDAIYPQKLKELHNPPLVLYAKGNLPLVDENLSICMVGARESSPYGVHEATKIALSLSYAGALLVTGMAQGIDTAVVTGALKSGKPLISVVAGGIDRAFPVENKHLYEDVATVGVMLSEYPPGTGHQARHFRPRNRILCGLSDGVMVVECLRQGGTMMTAQIAEDQQRDLFALPSSVRSPLGQGPHYLIQERGAYLTSCAEDILRYYQHRYPFQKEKLSTQVREERVKEAERHITTEKKEKKKKSVPHSTCDTSQQSVEKTDIIPVSKQKSLFTDDQIILLQTLENGEMATDILVEKSQIPAKRTLSAMTLLEMSGYVKEVSSGRFIALVTMGKE